MPTRGGGVAYRLPMNPPPAQPRFIEYRAPARRAPRTSSRPRCSTTGSTTTEDLVPPPLAAARAAAAKHDLLFDLRAFERKNRAFTGLRRARPHAAALDTLTTRIDALKASQTERARVYGALAREAAEAVGAGGSQRSRHSPSGVSGGTRVVGAFRMGKAALRDGRRRSRWWTRATASSTPTLEFTLRS